MTESREALRAAINALHKYDYCAGSDSSQWRELRAKLHAAAYASPANEEACATFLSVVDLAMSNLFDAMRERLDKLECCCAEEDQVEEGS